MTGEHALLYALASRGPGACTVRGYPQVTLYDASGRALPIRYAGGGGAYVTSRKPVRVSGPPGLSYCRGGPRDPRPAGHVSPIEGTLPGTSSLR
jgi:hypothetical protein